MEISGAIGLVLRRLRERWKPERVYLYNHKRDPGGGTTSFKLCLIMPAGDKEAVERDIYLDVDCEVPFDILLYTPEEWARFTGDPSSFAHKIMETGVLLA